jgi:hypothetical protein
MRTHSPRRRLDRALLLTLLLVWGSAGCDGVGNHQAPTADDAPTADEAPAAGHTLPRDTSSAAGDPTESRAVLALEGEGLRVFDASSGSARPVPFGTPADEVLRVLEIVQGAPPREQGESADCGGSYATWERGPSVRFRGDRMVGWSVGEPGATTAAGVGVGSTRRDLEAAYVVRLAHTSLGFEFSTGGLAGVLDGEGEDARIVALWAGEVCLAR